MRTLKINQINSIESNWTFICIYNSILQFRVLTFLRIQIVELQSKHQNGSLVLLHTQTSTQTRNTDKIEWRGIASRLPPASSGFLRHLHTHHQQHISRQTNTQMP